jgi:hypothetical protein
MASAGRFLSLRVPIDGEPEIYMIKINDSRDIEIRLNPKGILGKCFVCKQKSSDSMYGASEKIGAPDLFVREAGWICIFCARSYAPQLTSLIKLARAAEAYSLLIFAKAMTQESPAEPEILKFQFSLKIDQEVNSLTCGICKEGEVSLSVPEDKYQPGLPNLYINKSLACYDCVEKHAPALNRLSELADFSLTGEYFPTFNKNQNPVLDCLVNEIGWTTCPNCKKRFSTDDFQRFRYNRHVTCGQKIHRELAR